MTKERTRMLAKLSLWACIAVGLVYGIAHYMGAPLAPPALQGTALRSVLARSALAPGEVFRLGQTKLANPFSPASFLTEFGGEEPRQHPLLASLRDAQKAWSRKIRRQSRSFEKAARTYRARYGRAPPRGFRAWVTFAVKGRNHTLVDEYDSLMADLEPFRALSPAELRSRTRELAFVPGVSLLSIRGGRVSVTSRHGRWATASALKEMVQPFAHVLPDLDIAVNELPEGRVLPQTHLDVALEDFTGINAALAAELAAHNGSLPAPPLGTIRPTWGGEGTLWDAVRRSCPPDSPARRLVASVRSTEVFTAKANTLPVPGHGQAPVANSRLRQRTVAAPPLRELDFSPALDTGTDICAQPSLHTLHSAYFSDTRAIPALYPLFSAAKASGFRDILVPGFNHWSPVSDAEYESDYVHGRARAPADMPWAAKNDTLFWRGRPAARSLTADLSPNSPASSFQKQRLVRMLNDATMSERVLVAYDYATGSLVSASASTSVINSLVADAAFACDARLTECRQFRALGYRTDNPQRLSAWWPHRYVLDVDEDGASPLFFALMDSNSAVVKSSVQHEFWQDWVQPWVHFIPLSSSFFELYNIQTFFSGFPPALASSAAFNPQVLTRPTHMPELPRTSDNGPFKPAKSLEDIANQGKHWRARHARKEDMEVYMYRLLVEWAGMLQEGGSEESSATGGVHVPHGA